MKRTCAFREKRRFSRNERPLARKCNPMFRNLVDCFKARVDGLLGKHTTYVRMYIHTIHSATKIVLSWFEKNQNRFFEMMILPAGECNKCKVIVCLSAINGTNS